MIFPPACPRQAARAPGGAGGAGGVGSDVRAFAIRCSANADEIAERTDRDERTERADAFELRARRAFVGDRSADCGSAPFE